MINLLISIKHFCLETDTKQLIRGLIFALIIFLRLIKLEFSPKNSTMINSNSAKG